MSPAMFTVYSQDDLLLSYSSSKSSDSVNTDNNLKDDDQEHVSYRHDALMDETAWDDNIELENQPVSEVILGKGARARKTKDHRQRPRFWYEASPLSPGPFADLNATLSPSQTPSRLDSDLISPQGHIPPSTTSPFNASPSCLLFHSANSDEGTETHVGGSLKSCHWLIAPTTPTQRCPRGLTRESDEDSPEVLWKADLASLRSFTTRTSSIRYQKRSPKPLATTATRLPATCLAVSLPTWSQSTSTNNSDTQSTLSDTEGKTRWLPDTPRSILSDSACEERVKQRTHLSPNSELLHRIRIESLRPTTPYCASISGHVLQHCSTCTHHPLSSLSTLTRPGSIGTRANLHGKEVIGKESKDAQGATLLTANGKESEGGDVKMRHQLATKEAGSEERCLDTEADDVWLSLKTALGYCQRAAKTMIGNTLLSLDSPLPLALEGSGLAPVPEVPSTPQAAPSHIVQPNEDRIQSTLADVIQRLRSMQEQLISPLSNRSALDSPANDLTTLRQASTQMMSPVAPAVGSFNRYPFKKAPSSTSTTLVSPHAQRSHFTFSLGAGQSATTQIASPFQAASTSPLPQLNQLELECENIRLNEQLSIANLALDSAQGDVRRWREECAVLFHEKMGLERELLRLGSGAPFPGDDTM